MTLRQPHRAHNWVSPAWGKPRGADLAGSDELDFDDRLAMLLEREVSHRQERSYSAPHSALQAELQDVLPPAGAAPGPTRLGQAVRGAHNLAHRYRLRKVLPALCARPAGLPSSARCSTGRPGAGRSPNSGARRDTPAWLASSASSSPSTIARPSPPGSPRPAREPRYQRKSLAIASQLPTASGIGSAMPMPSSACTTPTASSSRASPCASARLPRPSRRARNRAGRTRPAPTRLAPRARPAGSARRTGRPTHHPVGAFGA